MNLATPDDKIIIGITTGDINGIGPEIIIKTLEESRMTELMTPVIYSSAKVMTFYKKMLEVENFNFTTIRSASEVASRKINLVNCWQDEVKVEPGASNENGARYAVKSLEVATADLVAGNIHALVTAPIDKKHLESASFQFPGHTEYISQKAGGKGLMMMVDGPLRVALVTAHIGIKAVSDSITKEAILDKLQILNRSLQWDFSIRKPKIAVLALNPHASDGGKFGDEEQKVIIPAIDAAKENNILAFGPYPADGFFASGNFENFDAVLAMYHDQGLIPFKAISGFHGVNYTAGLNVIRTSPDHGPAFDLAGKGSAVPDSFRDALYLACDIYKTRKNNKEYASKPLKSLSKEIEAKEDENIPETPKESIL